MSTLSTRRWLTTSALFLLAALLLLINGTTGYVGAATPTKTPVGASLSDRPTPTPDTRLPVIQTADALREAQLATNEARPTQTPGPSAIELDGRPQFVDFWAVWCGPCLAMRADLALMERKYNEDVNFWRIDVDNPGSDKLNRKYKISFIPYMVLLTPDGKVFEVLEGQQTQAQLEAALKRLLRASEK
ncbi:MAG: thioredoxin family protein [Anaerolineae bacterium]|nr:thioredoxin family protein [Anaerolineae bacterium]